MAYTRKELDPLYSKYLGRTASDEEIAGWSNYDGGDLETKFKEASGVEIKDNPYSKPISSINEAGYTSKPIDWESYIKQAYEAKQPEIESQIKGSAAGGGLDTGGYMTSLAKAKTASWSDMLGQIMGAKQAQQSFDWQKQLPFIQRNWENQDWTKQEGLARDIADMNKTTDLDRFIAGLGAVGSFF